MRATVRSGTVAALAVLFTAALTVPVQAAADPAPDPAPSAAPLSDPVRVVRGLNNPRQLTLVPGQGLLVAEAGRGGATEVPSPFTPTTFVGPTGSIAWVPVPRLQEEAAPVRLVRGLLSSANADGTFAIGPNGVGARSLARIDIPVTYQSHDFAAALPPGLRRQAGTLLRKTVGPPRVLADLARWEIANDPDDSNGTGDVISNPYAALAQPNRTLVADAAGNTVLSVSRSGRVSLFALLPDPIFSYPGEFDSDAVPTSLAEGPGGTIYVGSYASSYPDAGRVLVYRPSGGRPIETIYGFSFVNGIALGPDGSLYVSELFYGGDPDDLANPPGQLTKVAPDGERTSVPVPFPGGVAVDRRDNVYVAAWSLSPAEGRVGPDGVAVPDSDGQVWRLRF